MTYKELLDSVSFDEIVPFIERYHGWDALALYKIHYDYLRHLTPKQGEETTATVSNGELDESWPEPHLDAFPLEGDLWEHSLAKELIIEPDVKASLAEIAMCCLWHTSFYGFTEEEVADRFENLDYYAEDMLDSDITRLRAKRVIRAIEEAGGEIPSRNRGLYTSNTSAKEGKGKDRISYSCDGEIPSGNLRHTNLSGTTDDAFPPDC